MSGPIVLIDVSTIRDGMLDDLKARMTELADFVEASETRAISYQRRWPRRRRSSAALPSCR
jgi:hypothetical protein